MTKVIELDLRIYTFPMSVQGSLLASMLQGHFSTKSQGQPVASFPSGDTGSFSVTQHPHCPMKHQHTKGLNSAHSTIQALVFCTRQFSSRNRFLGPQVRFLLGKAQSLQVPQSEFRRLWPPPHAHRSFPRLLHGDTTVSLWAAPG